MAASTSGMMVPSTALSSQSSSASQGQCPPPPGPSASSAINNPLPLQHPSTAHSMSSTMTAMGQQAAYTSQMSSTEAYAMQMMARSTARVLDIFNFTTVSRDSLNALADLSRRYIERLCVESKLFMEHGGRTLCDPEDVQCAMGRLNIHGTDLHEYMTKVRVDLSTQRGATIPVSFEQRPMPKLPTYLPQHCSISMTCPSEKEIEQRRADQGPILPCLPSLHHDTNANDVNRPSTSTPLPSALPPPPLASPSPAKPQTSSQSVAEKKEGHDDLWDFSTYDTISLGVASKSQTNVVSRFDKAIRRRQSPIPSSSTPKKGKARDLINNHTSGVKSARSSPIPPHSPSSPAPSTSGMGGKKYDSSPNLKEMENGPPKLSVNRLKKLEKKRPVSPLVSQHPPNIINNSNGTAASSSASSSSAAAAAALAALIPNASNLLKEIHQMPALLPEEIVPQLLNTYFPDRNAPTPPYRYEEPCDEPPPVLPVSQPKPKKEKKDKTKKDKSWTHHQRPGSSSSTNREIREEPPKLEPATTVAELRRQEREEKRGGTRDRERERDTIPSPLHPAVSPASVPKLKIRLGCSPSTSFPVAESAARATPPRPADLPPLKKEEYDSDATIPMLTDGGDLPIGDLPTTFPLNISMKDSPARPPDSTVPKLKILMEPRRDRETEGERGKKERDRDRERDRSRDRDRDRERKKKKKKDKEKHRDRDRERDRERDRDREKHRDRSRDRQAEKESKKERRDKENGHVKSIDKLPPIKIKLLSPSTSSDPSTTPARGAGTPGQEPLKIRIKPIAQESPAPSTSTVSTTAAAESSPTSRPSSGMGVVQPKHIDRSVDRPRVKTKGELKALPPLFAVDTRIVRPTTPNNPRSSTSTPVPPVAARNSPVPPIVLKSREKEKINTPTTSTPAKASTTSSAKKETPPKPSPSTAQPHVEAKKKAEPVKKQPAKKKEVKSRASVDLTEDEDEAPVKGKANGDDPQVWICPVCSVAYADGANMVGCDTCDDWYHWACVGITVEPPAEQQWFCDKCTKKRSESKVEKRKGSSIGAAAAAKKRK